MVLLKEVTVRKYRKVRHATLKGLSALNILIGPNNCSKTSLLEAVNSLSKLSEIGQFLCPTCKSQRLEKAYPIGVSVRERDSYLGKGHIELLFSFDEKALAGVVGTHAMQNWKKNLSKAVGDSHWDFSKLLLKQPKKETTYPLSSEHLSILSRSDFMGELRRLILYCPERRLSRYKDEDSITEFVKKRSKEEEVSSGEARKILERINEIVGSEIIDYKPFTWELVEGKEEYKTTVENQGSGVRSLICLMFDALLMKEKGRLRLLLIDEPELGMNQTTIRKFLTFLSDELEGVQVFLATHNPTLLNPLLWRREDTSVYLFSVTDGEFVKVNLDESKFDPNTFAGYLPHTTSLKDIHFYVEGTYDVYIYQTLWSKYIRKQVRNVKERKRLLNRAGFYHLAGDNWRHMLYTIPGKPYKSIILLDGDKRNEVDDVLEKYEKSRLENLPSFTFCESASNIPELIKEEEKIPVYCIEATKIEDIFGPELKNKKEAIEAVETEEIEVPQDLRDIFDTFATPAR